MRSPLFFSPPALFSYFSGQHKSTILVNPTNSTTHIRVTRTRCSIGVTTRCSIKDTPVKKVNFWKLLDGTIKLLMKNDT